MIALVHVDRLHNRPQGVHQKMVDPDGTSAFDAIQHCEKFIEVNVKLGLCSVDILIFMLQCTGEAGDIFICHGFMVCIGLPYLCC